jgi:nicotinate-nucleotide adenylyltransferase
MTANKIKTVGIYGGSFNPVGHHHIDVMKETKKCVDELWVMPIGNHPLNKNIIDANHRINMLKIAYDSMLKRQKGIILNLQQTMYDGAKLDIPDDKELKSYAPQSTCDLMNWLRKNYDGIEFYIVIGSDNADNIYKWHNYENLLKENKFIIVNREMKCRYTPNNKYFNSNNVIKIINTIGNNRRGYKSSTEIRNMIKEGNFKEAEKYCPKKVVDYIIKEGLYGK